MEKTNLIIIVILVIIIVIMLVQSNVKPPPVTPIHVVIPQPIAKPIGGCAGTRYGCCPNGVTPRMDAAGSNC